MTVNRKTKLFTVAILLALVVPMVLSIVPASACEPCDGPGTGTPGYWKNHPDAWPVDEITIGGVTYTKGDAIAIMDGPVKGDKSITMFKALVAAMLNVNPEIGNCGWCIADTILETDTDWFVDCPLKSGVKASSDCWQYSHGEALYEALDAYNNGELCAAPRD